MYSLTTRLNSIIYSVMTTLMVACLLNHVTVRWGYFMKLSDSKMQLQQSDIHFMVREVDQFLFDRFYNEEALSFNFNMKVDLTPLMTWNTHTVFASIVCEFQTATTDVNSVTVWDQRI